MPWKPVQLQSKPASTMASQCATLMKSVGSQFSRQRGRGSASQGPPSTTPPSTQLSSGNEPTWSQRIAWSTHEDRNALPASTVQSLVQRNAVSVQSLVLQPVLPGLMHSRSVLAHSKTGQP